MTMTPNDILRKFLCDVTYVDPEELGWMLDKCVIAYRAVEKIYGRQAYTEAGQEAIEVMAKLRRYEAELRLEMSKGA
jgi:hypothetical protein